MRVWDQMPKALPTQKVGRLPPAFDVLLPIRVMCFRDRVLQRVLKLLVRKVVSLRRLTEEVPCLRACWVFDEGIQGRFLTPESQVLPPQSQPQIPARCTCVNMKVSVCMNVNVYEGNSPDFLPRQIRLLIHPTGDQLVVTDDRHDLRIPGRSSEKPQEKDSLSLFLSHSSSTFPPRASDR